MALRVGLPKSGSGSRAPEGPGARPTIRTPLRSVLPPVPASPRARSFLRASWASRPGRPFADPAPAEAASSRAPSACAEPTPARAQPARSISGQAARAIRCSTCRSKAESARQMSGSGRRWSRSCQSGGGCGVWPVSGGSSGRWCSARVRSARDIPGGRPGYQPRRRWWAVSGSRRSRRVSSSRMSWGLGWVVQVRPSGAVQVTVPSAARVGFHPEWCLKRWWVRHRQIRLVCSVGPVGWGDDVVGVGAGGRGGAAGEPARPVAGADPAPGGGAGPVGRRVLGDRAVGVEPGQADHDVRVGQQLRRWPRGAGRRGGGRRPHRG